MFIPRMNRFDAKHQEVKIEAEGEISFGSLSGRMMLHVEEFFEFGVF